MAVIKQNDSFVINDIVFSVGPSNIQVAKENLSYRWHVLRQSSSTKIPTAHGGCIVNVRIPIPTEDILKLHRLIVEFKQNPFAYVENKYLREEIVPHWPFHQKMAFTLLNMSVESIPGNVGLFAANLQMQWFNYFPYTHNFLFRDEWETDWIPVSNLSDQERENLPYLLYYKVPEEGKSISYIKKSIFDYITEQTENPPKDAHVKATVGDLEKQLDTWQGFVFDLLPLPIGMAKANPVGSPRQSKIYVRYFNELQNRALVSNFGIDLGTDNRLGARDYYYGLLSGSGGEFNGQDVTLPEYAARKGIAGQVISEMMKHDDFILSFNTYKFVDLPPSIKQALSISTSDHIKNTVLAFQGAARVGYDLGNVGGYQVTSPYGNRPHPVTGEASRMHYGIDLGYPMNTPVKAIADGTIEIQKNDPSGGGGRTVRLRHTDGTTYSEYLHLEKAIFEPGFPVRAGNIIAYSGNSGTRVVGGKTVPSSTGPHLHLGINVNGHYIDPIKWFADQAEGVVSVPDEKAQGPEDVDGDGIEKVSPEPGQPTFTNQTSNMIKPWYSAFDTMKSELTDQDKIFLAALGTLVKEGYQYYTKDPSVNGVFFKQTSIRIPGHGPFNGQTDSHNTILTKVNGTLRHIVAALPILGHEFPTHQHLGSTDANYNFEFVTLDYEGDRSGVGAGARLLEGARITLQQNGRNLRTIYDSWMATGDNFITRLFGTFDHYGPHNKKIIIASTQAATIEGNPGTSAVVLECEETLSYVNESLTKQNSATRGDYEQVYKKTINKISKIVKRAKQTPQDAADDATKAKIRLGISTGLLDDPSHGLSYLADLGLVATRAVDDLTNDFFDTNSSKDIVRDINADFYELDTSKVSGLTPEDIRQLSDLVTRFSYLLLLGQCILQEEKVGGWKQNGGDDSPINYNLYGAEKLLVPKGNQLVVWSQNNWGPGLLYAVKAFGAIGIYEKTAIGTALQTGDEYLHGTHAAISNNSVTNFVGYTAALNAVEKTGLGSASDVAWLSGAATPFDFIASIVGLAVGSAKGIEKGIDAASSFDPTLMDPVASEILLRAYLIDLHQFANDINVTFTGSTSEYFGTRLNQILPSNSDGSPLIQERFGLASTYLKVLETRVASSVPGSSTNSGLGIFTTEDWERNKLELIKSELIDLLQPIFNQPNLMKFFEIEEEVSNLLYKVIRDERDTLPDMLLPPHPYWNKTYLTPPDFYYFNYHEDGIYDTSNYALYDSLSNRYVDGIYSFMDSWLKDGLHVDVSGNYTGGEVTEGTRDVAVEFDGYDHPVASDFPSTIKPNGLVATDVKQSDSLKFFNPVVNLTGKGPVVAQIPFVASNFDRDVLYVPIATPDLIKRIQGIEFHFGRKEGYANEREEIARIFNSTKAINGKAEDTAFTHFFGAEDLKQIVSESKKDIISQKFTMKRAFPAFRLYLIEEDQVEDFLLRYDDFYHYNAIKDITIVKSRKIAGDTAVIVLQNIAGILDGSKRNILKDTDFLTEQQTADGQLTTKGKKIEESRSVENRDTVKEESVGSIVLRPGVNMQLRVGVGNDPNNLEVKLSGRVVDVAFSENADLIEITIQSFGVELEQVEKGLDPNESDTYNLTHKLLSALMLSPELIHFGRWEVGSQLQFGENKDAKLDFRKYKSNETFQKLTGIYFANTVNQISDLYHDVVDTSFAAHFTTGNNNGILGTFLSNSTFPIELGSDVVQIGVAFAWDAITTPIKLGARTLIPRLKNEITSKKAYAMSEPQDDNLFCPNPKDYVMRPNWGALIVGQVVKDVVAGRFIQGITKGVVAGMRAAMSQKLDISDLTYQLDNVTIWQVFHEMTLRHPNYIYAPMPYGKEFRYTMFFGVPSQRYWSKPAHSFFIARTNQTRKAISGELGDSSKEQGQQETFDTTYGISDFLKVFQHNKDLNQSISGGGSVTGKSPGTDGVAARDTTAQVNAGLNVASEIKEQQELLKKLGFSSIREALLEYYAAITLRFEPFRRYHMATSETDIISNNINVSEYNVANAVAVKYFSNDGKEQEGIKLVKLHDRIPDEEIRMVRAPDYSNVHNELLALRYAVGHLVYEAKEMYSGSLLLVGNSRIKPWDIIFVVDKYSDICGPIEVEQVVERISFDTGYITEIKPNAVVFANEISSFPILEGLKAFVAARTAEQDKIYSSYKGNDFFNDLAIAGFGVLEGVDRNFGTNMIEGRSAQALSSALQEDIVRVIGIPELNASTPMQATLTSMAWMLGGFFYINKSLDNQSIIVYPLLKNGIPMVAGIPSAQPETLWSITLGQVNLFMNDVTQGTTEFISRFKLLGTEALKAFTQDLTRNQQTTEASDRVSTR